eukprot:scaffold23556_cov58-Phaeocystis_antarctica.AAC.4
MHVYRCARGGRLHLQAVSITRPARFLRPPALLRALLQPSPLALPAACSGFALEHRPESDSQQRRLRRHLHPASPPR